MGTVGRDGRDGRERWCGVGIGTLRRFNIFSKSCSSPKSLASWNVPYSSRRKWVRKPRIDRWSPQLSSGWCHAASGTYTRVRRRAPPERHAHTGVKEPNDSLPASATLWAVVGAAALLGGVAATEGTERRALGRTRAGAPVVGTADGHRFACSERQAFTEEEDEGSTEGPYIGMRCLRLNLDSDPPTRIYGTITRWWDQEEPLWRMVHDDGDGEDLEEYEVEAAVDPHVLVRR